MRSKEERLGDLLLVTVSDIGTNHKALCMPNQDASDFAVENGDFVMAVSDGVGSCKKAEKGAQMAVEAVKKTFTQLKENIVLSNFEIAKSIIDNWKILISDNSVDDYCATIKAVIKVGSTVKLISLGDGIVAITSDGFSMASPVESRDFTNETKCLNSFTIPSDFWIHDFQLDLFVSYAVLCCTDGVANGLLVGGELDFVREIEKNTRPDALTAELESLITEISNYSFDDKTVGVIKYERKN